MTPNKALSFGVMPPSVSREHFGLPAAAVQFLKEQQSLCYDANVCEAGHVGLHGLDDLKLDEVWVAPELGANPSQEPEGYYAVSAVSLTATCAAYDPAHILLWLPREKLFGSWDPDHWLLLVFPEASGDTITSSPALYLGAQWEESLAVGEQFRPWLHGYMLMPGRPGGRCTGA